MRSPQQWSLFFVKGNDMKNVRFLVAGLLAASALAFSPVAEAQSSGQWYAGVGVGQSKAKDVCSFVSGVPCDDTDTATKIFGGYMFNQNLGVELAYADLGKATLGITGLSAEWKGTSWDILAVGIIPINPQFSFLGKIGVANWNVDANYDLSLLSMGTGSESASGSDITYALGVQYDFTNQLGLRGEWQHYSNVGDDNTTGQTDVDVIGASLLYRF